MEVWGEGGDELVVGLLGEGEGLGAVWVGLEGGDGVGDDGDRCEVLGGIVSFFVHVDVKAECASVRGSGQWHWGARTERNAEDGLSPLT